MSFQSLPGQPPISLQRRIELDYAQLMTEVEDVVQLSNLNEESRTEILKLTREIRSIKYVYYQTKMGKASSEHRHLISLREDLQKAVDSIKRDGFTTELKRTLLNYLNDIMNN